MKKIIVYALLLLACSTSLHAQESKPALLILDTAAVDVEESQSVIIQSYIVDSVHRTGDFIIVERTHLEDAVKEMKLSVSGMIDEETAAQIGRVTGAQYILLSSLAFSDERYHLSMRVVSVETAKITNTSVKSVKTFSNIERIVNDSVTYLLGKGPEPEAVDNFLSADLYFCMGFSQGPPADVLGLSYLPGLNINYNWGFNWGTLSLGGALGCNFTGTVQNTIASYKLYSVLAGMKMGYQSAFDFPVNVYISVCPGAGFTFLVYPEEVTGSETIIFRRASFAAAAELGIVVSITDRLGIKGFGNFTYVLLSMDDLILISPGIGISYRI